MKTMLWVLIRKTLLRCFWEITISIATSLPHKLVSIVECTPTPHHPCNYKLAYKLVSTVEGPPCPQPNPPTSIYKLASKPSSVVESSSHPGWFCLCWGFMAQSIGLDKSGYQFNIFLISPQRNKTRIPRKASSHLLGLKSREPQSERGY